MTDKHLVNTVRMLARKAKYCYESAITSGYSLLSSLQGEVAQDYVERSLASIELEDFLPDIYENLLNECERRELNPWN